MADVTSCEKRSIKWQSEMCFFFSGGWGVWGCFALPPQVEFLPRLDQRGHCHWPLFLTAWGCTKFHQGGVPTLVRSGKVFGRQRGHRH